jgi:hypothetical protein
MTHIAEIILVVGLVGIGVYALWMYQQFERLRAQAFKVGLSD